MAAHAPRPKVVENEGAEGAERQGEHSATPASAPDHAGIGQVLKLSIAQDLGVITTTLGITTAQLQADFAAGQSLATIAGAKTPNLITAIVTAETARINARVKPGGLTQVQATSLIAGLTAVVTTAVNAVPPKSKHGFGLPAGFGALFAAPAKHK